MLAFAALSCTSLARAQNAPPLQVTVTQQTQIVQHGPVQDWDRRADTTTYVHVLATDAVVVKRVMLNGREGQKSCDSKAKGMYGPDDLRIDPNSFPRAMQAGDEITIVWSKDCGQPIKVLVVTDKMSVTYPIEE